jgi:hypothetical protein
MVESSVDPDSDYPQHCPAILEVKANGKLYRQHVRFHPGSPEAALTRDDVLDKFNRNTSWLFGARAREVGDVLTQVEEKAPVDAMFRILASSTREPLASAV